MQTKIKDIVKDYLLFFIGSISYAVSVNCFTSPNNIAPGGLTGVGIMLNYLFELPIGTTVLIMNVPLFIWAYISLGGNFLGKTVVATLLSSVIIDIMEFINIPSYSGDRLLAAIFGGVFSGAGLALIFLRGGTTGGTDLLARLLSRKFRAIPMGRMILLLDMIVVASTVLVYRNIESALYAVIATYVSTSVIDALLYGSDAGKVLFIVTKNPGEVSKTIIERVGRGVTILQGKGAYTGQDSGVLMCAVRRNEVFRIRDIMVKIDPSSFIIVGDATQVLGEGFKGIEEKD